MIFNAQKKNKLLKRAAIRSEKKIFFQDLNIGYDFCLVYSLVA